MFTIEHDFDASVITLVDEGCSPLKEDIILDFFDDQIVVRQYNPHMDSTNIITFSPEQVKDLVAALGLPEGSYIRPNKI